MKSLIFLILSIFAFTGFAGKVGTLELVDGRKTQCEFLFKHPANQSWILRSKDKATVQSLSHNLVHKFNGKVVNKKRKLSQDEKQELEYNSLWGNDVSKKQIGKYAKEKWDKKPLIVWAKPGESASALEDGKWLNENGKLIKGTPWKVEEYTHKRKKRKRGWFDGDVLLPAADQEYKAIQPGNRDHLHAFTIRHLTVEGNARYNIRYTVKGNLWIKDKGMIGEGTQTGGLGSADTNKHTFARFCFFRPEGEITWAFAPHISHWVNIDTGDSGSLEVIGMCGGASDRLTLSKGTLVVSEDSYIGNGNRGSFYSMPGTTAILLDGSRVGCSNPIVAGENGTYGIGGTLSFGTKEHPLKKDFIFSGAFFKKEHFSSKAVPSQRTKGASFVLGPKGKMVVYSSNPKKARVIFCPRSKNLPVSRYVVPNQYVKLIVRKKKKLYPPKPEFWGKPEIPKGVTAVFHGKTNFNGVVFDGFYKGGILVDPAARKKWRNVSLGKNNQGKANELFAPLN